MDEETALATLSVLFESYDKETLLAVLEANEGHLERTIDTLLAMQEDRETASAAGLAPPPQTTLPPPPPQPSTSYSRRTTLPDDFLRVPGSQVSSDQEAQDRMLAEMLQNEMFRQEIQADRDFSSYIGADGRRYFVERGPPEKSAFEVANETLSAVGTKISSMSGAMKNKISQMYARFQSRHASADHRPLMGPLSDDEEDSATQRTSQLRHENDDETLRRRHATKTSPRGKRDTGRAEGYNHANKKD
ncbi:unnamed protein product [Aphanomyces euteiches]|uniref:CUE domain-containing protein n=1 Tax=Aphanomyces euteiches TaxID=100861 RepID=A0A6G0X068_9STRA|nr:hypothetical protein Ae201684_009813 [Aphanomyces euteiches]KAH9154629.1 hypothetical protein AeRB84_003298 [Aphanomyces euteiches]